MSVDEQLHTFCEGGGEEFSFPADNTNFNLSPPE